MTLAAYGNLPKISVIVVVRNAAGTIGRAMDSLTVQHYPKLEVVVWDGVSTDGTLDVLARYGDLVTRLVSEADDGPPDAYNRAFDLCMGDFIGYLNADDEFEPGMLWAVAEAILKDPQADVVTTGMLHRTVSRDGRRRVSGYYAAESQLTLTLENVLSDLPTFMLSRFIRRDLKLKVGPFNTIKDFCYVSNDREWMARIALMGCHNAIVPRALYGFDMHAESISTNPQNFLRIIEEHSRIAEQLLKQPALSNAQRRTVAAWQKRQLSYGFLNALIRVQGDKIRLFYRQGTAVAGWRFIPLAFILLLSRMARKLGLMLSGGIDRG